MTGSFPIEVAREVCPHCESRRVIKVWPAATEETAPMLFLHRNCLDCSRPFTIPWPTLEPLR